VIYRDGRPTLGFLLGEPPPNVTVTQSGSGDPRPLILVYRPGVSAAADAALRERAPAALIATDTTPTATVRPLAETVAALEQLVGARLSPIVLAGFSEGGLGTRQLLQLGADPDALVIADGTYGAPDGWRPYADRARRGTRVFVASHGIPVSVASPWRALSALTGETLPLAANTPNRPDAPVLREPFERRQYGSFIVYSYGGTHSAQGAQVLPTMIGEALARVTPASTAGVSAGAVLGGAALVGAAGVGAYYSLRPARRRRPSARELSRPTKTALIAAGAVAVPVLAYALWPKKTGAAPSGCAEQRAQAFLIRTNYLKTPGGLAAAIRYRTEQYGYFPGFGSPDDNAYSPSDYATNTTFMNLSVRLNHRIVPALKCVEATIRRECSTSYQPKALSGLRLANSYHGIEVSNHVYGIALDIDPNENPCCGCIDHWKDDPLCARPSSTEYDRMTMPECWVHVFERYGFYWLGHDPNIRDTMHFEFLGVPAQVNPSVLARSKTALVPASATELTVPDWGE